TSQSHACSNSSGPSPPAATAISSRASRLLGSAMKANRASPAVENSPARLLAVTSIPRPAVCSISRKESRSLLMADLLFAFDYQRHHRCADCLLAHFAELFFEAIQRHDGFGHGAMAAGAANVVV